MRTHVEGFATKSGWNRSDGEGAFEFVQRKCYHQGWQDGRREALGDVHRDTPEVAATQPTKPEQQAEPVAVLRFQRDTPGHENDMPAVASCNRLPDGYYRVYLAAPAAREASKPVQAEAAKTPGMAVMGLAGEIVVALLADENDGGYDLEAGLFGPAFSTLVRRWADAEWLATQPQAIPAAPAVQASGEREAFEAKWPTPPGCQWTGNGYASIRYHDWAADDHAKRWEGWKARAAIASPPAINPPKGE